GLYTLYFARPVLLPIVLGILISFVLDPFVGLLERWHVPRALGAAFVLGGVLGGIGYGVYRLSGPAAEWVEQAPRNVRQLEEKLREIRQPVADVERATQEVERITSIGEQEPANERSVRVSEPPLAERIVTGMREFLASGVLMIVLLYFLLSSGDLFVRKLAKVLPTLHEKRRAVQVVKEVRAEVSGYLLTVSLINVGLGAAVAGVLWLLDMPNAVLWGVVAGVLNFVPYVGPLIGVLLVGFASLLEFEGIGRALLAPGAYLALNMLEGNFVTPAVLGRRISVNPVAVFLGLLFWGWIWGVPGALMAVPIVATLKILCDHYEPLAPLGEFMGR
ncbi:MAG: AI-2E family transporter, partial [Gemmatimonadota bacterium]